VEAVGSFDAEDVHNGDGTHVLSSLPLGIIEVRGYGNDGVIDKVAQVL
jgi:hypothetical protein